MNKCFVGDCRDTMRQLIADGVRVQMCVTSPPYWGLRDYGTAQWDGGDTECAHEGSIERLAPPGTDKQASNRGTVSVRSGDCLCGATRIDRQLGLEKTPDEYVSGMVDVFRLVRELLVDDGVLWLNLGDSYNGYMANQRATSISANNQHARPLFESGHGKRTNGLKSKDLVGIPWRLAFALQADGWCLRQDIIWAKPNPMPESVTDRCTKSHEYIFLLSKRERYYYDAAAIKEPYAEESFSRYQYAFGGPKSEELSAEGHGKTRPIGMREYKGQATKDYASGGAQDPSDTKRRVLESMATGEGRNKRSVWTETTKPFSGAHFATFPPELIEPCILAGSRPNDIVLDPFFGSGTTGEVAQRLGRQWLGCELNGAYEPLQRARTAQQGLVLA